MLDLKFTFIWNLICFSKICLLNWNIWYKEIRFLKINSYLLLNMSYYFFPKNIEHSFFQFLYFKAYFFPIINFLTDFSWFVDSTIVKIEIAFWPIHEVRKFAQARLIGIGRQFWNYLQNFTNFSHNLSFNFYHYWFKSSIWNRLQLFFGNW